MKDTKYRLKKDTPFYKKGTEFCENWNHKGELLNDDCIVVADLNELDNPDEWFEEVSDKWPQCGDNYYYLDSAGEVSPQVVFSYSRISESRRELGNTFKTRNATRQFIRFLKAMEVIRHDEGFMKKGDDTWTVTYNSDNELVVQCVIGTYREYAGMVYFDTSDHARKSINEHPFEWHDILRHDWSKGEDEENED